MWRMDMEGLAVDICVSTVLHYLALRLGQGETLCTWLHLLFNRIYITIYNYAEVKALRKGWKSGTEGV